jgi:hypothetical protein
VKVGLQFRETFRGSLHRLDDPLVERAVDLHLVVHLDEWRRLLREASARVEGSLSIEGIADRAELTGTVRYRLRSEKRVPYEFAFSGDDGKRYRLRGQREPHRVNPLEVLTNLRFSLYDGSDGEIARGLVRCDLRTDLRRTVSSVRLRLTD